MLATSDDRSTELEIYSSWPLVPTDKLHANHLGRLQTTEGARAISLDTYLAQAKVSRVDFIKLDVDGYECEVLGGARHCLDSISPANRNGACPICSAGAGSFAGAADRYSRSFRLSLHATGRRKGFTRCSNS